MKKAFRSVGGALASMIAIVSTALVATFGLVMEDLTKRTFDPSFWWRVGITLGLTVVLIGLLGRAAERIRRTGTLYYLSFLHVGASDSKQKVAIKEASKIERQDLRALRRRFPLSADAAGLDLADALATYARDLEMTMNEDSSETAFQIAPNMRWFAAVRVGLSTPLWQNTTLREENPGRKDLEFQWDPALATSLDLVHMPDAYELAEEGSTRGGGSRDPGNRGDTAGSGALRSRPGQGGDSLACPWPGGP
ncbi:hypothetical protein [Aeromicrobium duanguangcaii]|uniref:hypothetical protein n=1 Tax=Aeromicrobium duanguangcaii TaxID=2968086 RepID=UPI0020175203|nr:hypothetical protein [Aeromicrobium duanguangcaii]MCL3836871.1 hypothetical protein [Aeromicrobium duanguangcaii]